MKTDPQHLLPAHVPFYRRRWFWGVVFFIFFVMSSLLMASVFQGRSSDVTVIHDVHSIYDWVTFGFGTTLIKLIMYDALNGNGQYIGTTAYFILLVYLAFKTFQTPTVLIRYPVIFSVIYITGLISTFFLTMG